MPNTKISALTAGDPALSTDALPIARSGANYQVTAASVASLVNRLAAITASATPVVLTVSSAPVSSVSGSGGQVIQLPNATTLTVGSIFRFNNNQTSGAITVNNNSGTLVVSVPSGSYVEVTLLTNGTAAGTWDRHDLAPSNVSWSTNIFDYAGSITSATWNGVTVATNRGGTGLASYTTGDLVYASATNTLSKLGVGTSNYALLSNGTTPVWGQLSLTTGVTGTLPVANGGTGNSSWTIGSLISFSGTTTASAITPGTPNYVLTTGGTGTIPSWTQVSLTAAVTGTLPVANGGTSFASYTVGDLLVANGTTSLSKLADVATGNALISGGVGVAPSYGKIGLTTHVSGTLPIANGGTGQTTASAAFNALSPVTTTGDLIIGNGTNSSTRLAIGSNTYVLTSNGTTASWQPAAGGGGGVTSFSAGSTGFSPSSATTGAVTLSGTLNTGNGGTGTSSTPSNGQLLIGNGSGYTVANLTAGTGVTITNSSGGITIAASGGGGPTISVLAVSTSSSGSFNNSPPSSSLSKPLIGSVTSPSNYGAFFFKNNTNGYLVTSGASLTSISILDSTGASTSYTSGTDFFSPSSFEVYDSIVTCYGLFISNAAMQTLFASSKSAITSPSVAPLDAASGFGSTNPGISVSTSGSTYTNASGQRGIVVSKSGSSYILEFGSADLTSASPSVTSIGFNINGSPSSYSNFSDFSVSFANNSSNGQFTILMSVSNATLQTLLDHSFL